MLGLLTVTGRIRVFLDTLKDKATMRYLVPASFLITFNWGLYVWAVNNERVLDSSLGYYMNPLIAFLLAVLIFKEKYTKLQLVAVGLAFTGVLISLIAYGSFPVIAICLSLSFATYGVLKKKAQADPAASIAIESLIITPFALALPLVFMMDGITAASSAETLLLIGGGALTALPLFFYARAINDIPFIIVGFLQYISPSLTLIYGLLMGEILSNSQIVSFIFIGLGLIVFSTALVIDAKRSSAKAD
jgi:chloramphenicol-sensitive protein RarD